jgi:hypothetical protein
MSHLTKAIKALRPQAEFSFINDDYTTIIWDSLEGNPPTLNEINAAIEKIKADEIQATKDAEKAKLAAQSKLEALGLTSDDLRALGL